MISDPLMQHTARDFFALAQGLIDVGARAGRVDVKQLLPDPTTVSRGVNKYAEEIRQKLIPELKMQLEGVLELLHWSVD